MTDLLKRFPAELGDPYSTGFSPEWTVVDGDPAGTTWINFASADASMIAGVWNCTPGAFEVTYSKWEFCQLLSGSCTITPEGGEPMSLKAGDAFVLDAGFRGRWEVTETMTKHFVFQRLP